MRKHFFIVVAALIFGLFEPSEAQIFRNGQRFKARATSEDSLIRYGQSDIFDFPNIGNIDFYFDKRKLNHILHYISQGKEEQAYVHLKQYVRNFGIENFRRTSGLIWDLARYSKKFGPSGEALLLYKMAIKHFSDGMDTTALFKEYDSLERDKPRYYVPIDYYLKLVDARKDVDTMIAPRPRVMNMGERVNSKMADYAPTIGNADDILLFTSKRTHTRSIPPTFDEDIFFTTFQNGEWSDAIEFKEINTTQNEGSACLSLDGTTLIFSRCNAPGSYGNCDLYQATLQPDGAWGDIHNLGTEINSPGWDSHPALSHRGDTLFFASNRGNGFGLSDIYFSVRDKFGNWTTALNAGPVINTRNSEISPFFHHRENVLYFSSNGHNINFGRFDIYKAKLLNANWTDPKNTGPLVNGAGNEYYFTIDSKSLKLYFARSNDFESDNLDLCSYPVPMEAQPGELARIFGTLRNKEGKPIHGIVSVIDLDHGVPVAPKFTREDGSFDFELIDQRNYLLIVQGDEFFRMEEVFFLNGELEINKTAEPIDRKIAFKSIEFESGKADILEAMYADLDKVGNFLLDNPEMLLNISGHTDANGDPQLNLDLSQQRADNIKDYLVLHFNLNDLRISAMGYGSKKPVVKEVTEEDRKINRRVEFEIYRN